MGFMDPGYPNLELIEYKARQLLAQDEEFVNKIKELREKNRYASVQFEADVFPQMWGSTCTGFDVTENGEPAIGGCAMTKEYTTVVHELLTDVYVVFFGNKPCYKVSDANEFFFEDLKKRNMASLSEAKKRY